MVNGMLSRRRLLQLILAAPVVGMARAAAPARLAVLDWGLTELALALGVAPVAVSAPVWYRKLINDPVLPGNVLDIGLLFQPNLEALYSLRPDRIVITPAHGLLKPALKRIAPVVTLPVSGLAGYSEAATMLGDTLQRQSQAAIILARLQQKLADARQVASSLSQPVFLALPVDMLHMKLLGIGSLPGDVLAGCGIPNAWQGKFNAQGEVLVELAQIGDANARLIVLPAEVQQRNALQYWMSSPLWRRLPLTSARRISVPESFFNEAGALVTAGRIADMLNTIISGWRHG